MIWRMKEKPLTTQEAITLAKKALYNSWFNSEPLLVGIRDEKKISVHPLDQEFNKKPWFIVFLDPTTFSGLDAINLLREWFKRYGPYNMGFLGVIKPPYNEYYKGTSEERLAFKEQKNQLPLVIDIDGLICGGFCVNDFPRALLLKNGETLIEHDGPSWADGLEIKIHKFLRDTDPGLPLLPVIADLAGLGRDIKQVEFGKKATDNRANFSEIDISPKFEQNEEAIIISDSAAVLKFESAYPRFSVVAKSYSKLIEPVKLMVELDGLPVGEDYHGESLSVDEEGRTIAKISVAGVYHLLRNLDPAHKQVTLRTPTTKHAPLAVFGFRFSL
ncbi:MAG: hypothetical protein AABZ06_08365 [Bdellovibrionota bacterium]